MIDQEIILELTKKYQTGAENIWREYCQHVFLSYLFQQEESDKLYFKGGTALRVIYKSPRFSEDLDFSTSLRYNTITIENILVKTLTEVEREGIKTQLEEAKPTTGGYLSIINFDIAGRIIPIKIEISERNGEKQGEVAIINNEFTTPYSITQFRQKLLIGEKMQALLSRHKPRDFYDLYFLLRSDLIETADKKKVLSPALDLLQKTDINFEHELKQFLPKSHWMIIRDFKHTLEQEIKRYL
ncbi:MAG: hypothetical protein A2288_03865 [Candidatus Moranbacteria bacterium RIFOXYA12_FULL_44_15]|nr:MAG: hypothetical protein A2288_03865 [Candidatus Moranbacteria bacterium RIFOXYA12_FULL_44_15]OGI35112.1 MAG: hypothetical protein A2259_03920 [Candidatus Moranbacteria bacterium RIFOXYA2_FULL_43_15]